MVTLSRHKILFKKEKNRKILLGVHKHLLINDATFYRSKVELLRLTFSQEFNIRLAKVSCEYLSMTCDRKMTNETEENFDRQSDLKLKILQPPRLTRWCAFFSKREKGGRLTRRIKSTTFQYAA